MFQQSTGGHSELRYRSFFQAEMHLSVARTSAGADRVKQLMAVNMELTTKSYSAAHAEHQYCHYVHTTLTEPYIQWSSDLALYMSSNKYKPFIEIRLYHCRIS